jgi:flavin-dependent dehydrogenase
MIPTNGGQTLVFAGVARERFAATFRDGLYPSFLKVAEANAPELREAVEGAELSGRLRIFAGAPGFMKRCHGLGWALVGDAGYFKDPLTAHGMTDALCHAELLARAVVEGRHDSLARYQEERDALSRRLFDVTERVASVDWTLDEVKQLHHGLSDAMKAETEHMASLHDERPLAA